MLSKLRVVFSLDIAVNNVVSGLIFVVKTWTVRFSLLLALTNGFSSGWVHSEVLASSVKLVHVYHFTSGDTFQNNCH